MRYRFLRIAWSVAWGLVAVLLCVLWVRSYWWEDALAWPGLTIGSASNAVAVKIYDYSTTTTFPTDWRPVWWVYATPAQTGFHNGWKEETLAGFHIQYDGMGSGYLVAIPYWFLVVLSCIFTFAPWIRWSKRFSLRTMWIAVTLVAVGLAVVVWIARR